MLNMLHGWSKHFTSCYDSSTPLHPNPPPIHPPHGSSRQLILAADVAELLLSSAVASEAFLRLSVRKSSFLSRPRAFPSSAVGDLRQDDDDRGRRIISLLLRLGGWRRHHRNGGRRSVVGAVAPSRAPSVGGGAESRPRGTAIASFDRRRPRAASAVATSVAASASTTAPPPRPPFRGGRRAGRRDPADR